MCIKISINLVEYSSVSIAVKIIHRCIIVFLNLFFLIIIFLHFCFTLLLQCVLSIDSYHAKSFFEESLSNTTAQLQKYNIFTLQSQFLKGIHTFINLYSKKYFVACFYEQSSLEQDRSSLTTFQYQQARILFSIIFILSVF